MGTYSTQEFLDTFGGLPDRDDPQWAGPDPDVVRDQRKEAGVARKLPAYSRPHEHFTYHKED